MPPATASRTRSLSGPSHGTVASSLAPISPPSTSSASYDVSAGSASPAHGRHTSRTAPASSSQTPTSARRAGGLVLDDEDARTRRGRRSQDRQHHVPLVGGDLGAVLLPLGALVAQEEVVDVLAQRLGQQLGVLGDADRVAQVPGQRLDAERPALALGERPDVVLGLARAARSPPRCPSCRRPGSPRRRGRGCRPRRWCAARRGSTGPCWACTSAPGSSPSGCCGPSRCTTAPRRRRAAACRS